MEFSLLGVIKYLISVKITMFTSLTAIGRRVYTMVAVELQIKDRLVDVRCITQDTV